MCYGRREATDRRREGDAVRIAFFCLTVLDVSVCVCVNSLVGLLEVEFCLLQPVSSRVRPHFGGYGEMRWRVSVLPRDWRLGLEE